MSENHRHPNGFPPAEFLFPGNHSPDSEFFYPAGNHSPEQETSNRNHQIVPAARFPFPGNPSPSTENNPYQLVLNSNQYPIVLNTPTPNNLNPDFLQNLSDSTLESQFGCLSLSSVYPQSQFPARSSHSGGGSLIGNNNPWIDSSLMGSQFSPSSYSVHTEYDSVHQERLLQWLRIQSAIAGHNGFNGVHGINNFTSNNLSRQIFPNGTENNSRCPAPIRPPPRNQNRVESGSGSGLEIGGSQIVGDPRTEMNNGSGPGNHIGSNDSNGNVEQRVVMGSLVDFKGKIYLLTRSQRGCSYLMRKFEEGDPQEIELFYGEVKDGMREIMLDRNGSVMIQKFFDVCTKEHVSQILGSVFSDEHFLIALCLDPNGTRALQKLLELTSKEQRKGVVISVIVRITVTLSTNMYGNHVMQKCLRFFSDEEVESILNVIADNCVDIARDKSGCCVIQQCVVHAQRLRKDRLISQIISNALLLSDDPFGNYVVQFIMQLRMPQVNARILEQLKGNYLALSMSKFGSNVVENCLKYSLDYNTCDAIIREFIRSPPDFLMLAQHPFGNYVIQSALYFAKGTTKRDITSLIQFYHAFLQSHPHGKRVLDITRGRRPQQRSHNHQQEPRFFMGDHQN